jgi:hypothetical protein
VRDHAARGGGDLERLPKLVAVCRAKRGSCAVGIDDRHAEPERVTATTR